MTRKAGKTVLHVAARKVGAKMVGTLAVGDAVIEIISERSTTGGTHTKRFAAAWTKGAASGDAYVDIRPVSKAATQVTVTLERPAGPRGLLWPALRLRQLGHLLASALAYDIETRSIEEATAFDTRRTSPELVKARAS